jgi:hypothetical protein
MDIEVLAGELNRLVASDGFSISDKESLIALERFSAQLDCALSKAVASFEDGGEWAPDGAQTPVAWIATRCHVPKTEARRQLRLGRAMAHMPVVQKAWSKGDIGTAQVETLVKLRTVVTEESFGRDEAVLVEAAENLKFEAFLGVAKYWENMADPDGAKESDFERQARRNAYLVKDANGNWVGQLTLDPISGAIVSNELARIEQELFDADWAKAKAELGREPKIGELSRTSANRRADAVVEMATRSASTPADGRRPRPLFSILVGWETLYGRLCELAGAQVLSPDVLFPWLDVADFERVVFAPGKRVEVSPTSRFFTGATRRAIELRDRECTHPYCDLPADQCQIDHIIPWNQGGRTDQENGRVMCGFHNRLRNGREPPDEPA